MKKVKNYLADNRGVIVICIFTFINLMSTLKIAAAVIMTFWIIDVTYRAVRDFREGKRKNISTVAWKLFYMELSIKLSAVVLYALFVYMQSYWKWPIIGVLVIYLICSLKYYWSYEEER